MTDHVSVGGEALPTSDDIDLAELFGSGSFVDMQQEPHARSFNAYRVAFRANQAEPRLANATALVSAYRELMDAIGLKPSIGGTQ